MFKLLLMSLFLFDSLEIKQTQFQYDEAIVLSRYNKQKVAVFVNCDVISFVDKKKTLVVHLQKCPSHTDWKQYKEGGVLVGEWQNNQFVVLKFVPKHLVNEQIMLTQTEVKVIPQQYQGCVSCQQLLLNKLRR